MSFRTNLSERPIPADTYHVRIKRAEEKRTKKTGDPLVVVEFDILDGPEQGRSITFFVSFVPQMIGRNNHFLRIIGQPYGEDVEIDPLSWIGQECKIKTTIEANEQGNKRVQVVGIESVGTAAVANADDEVPF